MKQTLWAAFKFCLTIPQITHFIYGIIEKSWLFLKDVARLGFDVFAPKRLRFKFVSIQNLIQCLTLKNEKEFYYKPMYPKAYRPLQTK